MRNEQPKMKINMVFLDVLQFVYKQIAYSYKKILFFFLVFEVQHCLNLLIKREIGILFTGNGFIGHKQSPTKNMANKQEIYNQEF